MFAFFSYDPRSATVDLHNTRLAMNGMRQAIVLLWICEKWSREYEHVLVFTGLFGFCYLMYKKCNEFLGTLKIIHINVHLWSHNYDNCFDTIRGM